MNISAFDGLMGKKLSIATSKNKRDGTPESYIGYLEKVGEDYVVIDYDKAFPKKDSSINKIILLIDTIVGIWVYEE